MFHQLFTGYSLYIICIQCFYFILNKSPTFYFPKIQFLKVYRVPMSFKTLCECQGYEA